MDQQAPLLYFQKKEPGLDRGPANRANKRLTKLPTRRQTALGEKLEKDVSLVETLIPSVGTRRSDPLDRGLWLQRPIADSHDQCHPRWSARRHLYQRNQGRQKLHVRPGL